MLDRDSIRTAANEIAQRDPALLPVLNSFGPPPLWKRPQTFATLVRIILEQQVSLSSAKATFDRLSEQLDGGVTASAVRDVGEEGLKSIGFSRQKARYSVALADDVIGKRFRIAALRGMTDQEAEAQIVARLGLGKWSASVYMMMAMLRPDILPTGDLALAKGLTEIDGGDYRDHDSLLSRAECWRPHRSVGVRMVWQAYLNRRGQVFDAT